MTGETFFVTLWREAIRTGPPLPDVRDLLDWAMVLETADASADARILRDCAAIVQGFSPEALAEQARAGLPPKGQGDALPSEISRSTAAGAADEIDRLARAFEGTRTPTLALPLAPQYSGYPQNPDGIGPGIPAGSLPGDLGATAAAMVAILGDPDPQFSADTLQSHLDTLVEARRRLPGFEYQAYATAPLSVLARAIAQTVLVDFACTTRDMWSPPLGSIAFFHTVARLGSARLGPYLRNVGAIARHSRDVYDMARRAQLASGHAGNRAVFGAWLAILARGCSGYLLLEIVDDLGDYAASATLGAILDRLANSPWLIEAGNLIRRIRDIGLDTGDHVLAARAQAIVIASAAQAPHEQVILGDIHASGGDFAAAEGAYRGALGMIPEDTEVLAKLAMVRRDQSDSLNVHQGYHSPPDRAEPRLHKRGSRLAYPRRRGEIVAAVDVS